MRLSLPQSPLVVKVWSNCINKYARYLADNGCSELTHARMDARTLWKHMPPATTLVKA